MNCATTLYDWHKSLLPFLKPVKYINKNTKHVIQLNKTTSIKITHIVLYSKTAHSVTVQNFRKSWNHLDFITNIT